MPDEKPTVGAPKPVATTLPARLRRPARPPVPVLVPAPEPGPFIAYEFLFKTETGNEVQVFSATPSAVPPMPEGCYVNLTPRDSLENYKPLEIKFATQAERDAAIG